MKYVTAMALGAAFALASCVSKGTVVRVEDQRDSLVSVVSAKDSLINAVFEDINAISENLVLIKTRENLISVEGGSEGGRRPVEEINNDIAAIARLLQARGYTVTIQKLDPYINIDPGTMNPIQHGEVFVTDDGAETDLDLGHYERFIDESLTKNSNVTTGKVYWSVLQKERRGDFGGGTVQVIPHITNEIKSRFYRNFTSDETHIAIIEVGGTVGDIESQPFLEAIRQFQHEVGHENAILIHVTLIPY